MPQYEDSIIFLLAKAYQKAHFGFKQKLAPFNSTPVQQLVLAVLTIKDAPGAGFLNNTADQGLSLRTLRSLR